MTQMTRWIVLVLCALTVATVGSIVSSDALFFLSAFLLMIPLTSYTLGMISLHHLDARCGTAPPVLSGEALEIPVEVQNSGVLPRFDIRLVLALPPELHFAPGRNGYAPSLNAAGEELPEPSDAAAALLPHIPGRGWSRTRCRVATRRRGCFFVGPLILINMDPLKLSRIRRTYSRRCPVVVYPQPLGVSLTPLIYGDLLGVHQTSRTRGSTEGSEFYGLRPYRPGDERRRIHWPTTARLGSLTVVEREAQSALSLVVAIDLAAPGGDSSQAPLEVLISLAAQLSEEAIRRSTNTSILLLSPDGMVNLVVSRSADYRTCLDALARIEPTEISEMGPPEALAGGLGPDPSLVVLTDRLDDRIGRLVGVRSRGPGAIILLDAEHAPEEETLSHFNVLAPIWRLSAHLDGGGYSVEPLARLR